MAGFFVIQTKLAFFLALNINKLFVILNNYFCYRVNLYWPSFFGQDGWIWASFFPFFYGPLLRSGLLSIRHLWSNHSTFVLNIYQFSFKLRWKQTISRYEITLPRPLHPSKTIDYLTPPQNPGRIISPYKTFEWWEIIR